MDAEAILKTPALDAREVVEWIPGAFTRPCGPDECVMVRGRPRRLTVVVDEIPAWGGLQDLTLYTPEDLHSVEFVPSCAVVRVYTRWFIERMARRNIPLLPNVCSARW